MSKTMLVELYVGNASPAHLSEGLARAGVPIRSVLERHVYVEVPAETWPAALQVIRDAIPTGGMELSPVASYGENGGQPLSTWYAE